MDTFSKITTALHGAQVWSTEDIAQIFGRLITESALENDLPVHLAVRWGTRAGHYGLLALRERDEAERAKTYDALRRQGFAVVNQGLTGERP